MEENRERQEDVELTRRQRQRRRERKRREQELRIRIIALIVLGCFLLLAMIRGIAWWKKAAQEREARRKEQELREREEELLSDSVLEYRDLVEYYAEEEGIDFRLLCNPVRIEGWENPEDPRDPKNGCVKAIVCVLMELGEPDASGRRRPVEIPGSEFSLDVDTVVMAIGTSPNPLIKNTTEGLDVNSHGGIIVNEEGLTSRKAVFAGGDAVTGAATVISAMGAGKTAAKAIDEYLTAA